ncbi:hypothetical protein HJG60_011486 [Phyllostomus discolor]|uniref:Uncharacterized protein n=1 Tax=Phyllostomus discolor TaxID=89673 RepID=A0A833ZVV3_9CHIR|nr:hypothetical protein HJG60_011486 [Phyllostomus discolor]
MGTFLAAAPIATLAPPMLALWEQRAPGSARSSGVALAPPPSSVSFVAAAASTYPPSPGREWELRLHARGGGAGSTMVPGAAPQFLARLLAARSLPLANFRVLPSTRNRGDLQQVFPVQVGEN